MTKSNLLLLNSLSFCLWVNFWNEHHNFVSHCISCLNIVLQHHHELVSLDNFIQKAKESCELLLRCRSIGFVSRILRNSLHQGREVGVKIPSFCGAEIRFKGLLGRFLDVDSLGCNTPGRGCCVRAKYT